MLSVDIHENTSRKRLGDAIKLLLGGKNPVILCVGCDKVAGDCLGPMVGSKLIERLDKGVAVYGLMESNVNAKNLLLAKDLITSLHPDQPLLVIDAALGTMEEVETVQLHPRGLYPGSATNKNLPSVGDISIMGVVNLHTVDEMAVLYSTKMNIVSLMSEIIAQSITDALVG